MAYQWSDLMQGEGPESLKDLPCDCWGLNQNDKKGPLIICMWCGWYRHIPEGDVKAAEALQGAIELLAEREDG